MKLLIIPILVIVVMIEGCQKRGEEEIVILHKDYTGYVVIIYNQKTGTRIKYEGKKRVYEIPAEGILKTQFSGNYGWVGFTEFYYENIAPENKIPFIVESKNIPVDSVVAFGGSTGNANKNLDGEETIEFRLFYVGNEEQIDKAYQEAEKLDIVKLAN